MTNPTPTPTPNPRRQPPIPNPNPQSPAPKSPTPNPQPPVPNPQPRSQRERHPKQAAALLELHKNKGIPYQPVERWLRFFKRPGQRIRTVHDAPPAGRWQAQRVRRTSQGVRSWLAPHSVLRVFRKGKKSRRAACARAPQRAQFTEPRP
jgi:hypothetical protein